MLNHLQMSANVKEEVLVGDSSNETAKKEVVDDALERPTDNAVTPSNNDTNTNGSLIEEPENPSETSGNQVAPSSSADSDDSTTAADNDHPEGGETNSTAPVETIQEAPRGRDSVNGWETPPQESVNGILQPRVIPPVGKPTRHTNQLDFILKEVLKPVKSHKHAWPFLKPVDAIKLNIPDYHKIIKRPMDLTTIEKRLLNVYYYSADDCLRDVMTVFTNCFLYNEESETGVYAMGKSLEKYILSKLNKIPPTEYEIDPPGSNKRPGGKGKKSAPSRTISDASARIGGSVSISPRASVAPETTAAVLDLFHNATVQGAPPPIHIVHQFYFVVL
jgi:hypothetical protein